MDPRCPGRLEEARRAVDAVAVDQGDRGEAEARRLLDQVFGKGRAIQKRKGRGDAQLRVGPRARVAKVEPRLATLQHLLARPRGDDERRVRGSDVARGHTEIAGGRTIRRAVGGPVLLPAHPPTLWRNKGVSQCQGGRLAIPTSRLTSELRLFHPGPAEV